MHDAFSFYFFYSIKDGIADRSGRFNWMDTTLCLKIRSIIIIILQLVRILSILVDIVVKKSV